MERSVKVVGGALRALGGLQLLLGGAAVLGLFLAVRQETLERVAEEIMMTEGGVRFVALALAFLVLTSGIFSLMKIRWGWLYSFLVATIVLLMASLMGPGTIVLTKLSFLALMTVSLLCWADAIVYYFHDLYT